MKNALPEVQIAGQKENQEAKTLMKKKQWESKKGSNGAESNGGVRVQYTGMLELLGFFVWLEGFLFVFSVVWQQYI